ncbi:MAG: helix-turn-helix transcriptional regulator [Agriterribacter sp.]
MEYIPSDILKPYIKYFAVYTTQEAGMYKVLPGANIVMGFQFKGKLKYIEQGKEIALSTSGISGLTDSYRIFKNETNTGSVLVYFKEAGASVFFKEPVHEIFRESLSLDNFILRSELLLLEEKLGEATTDEKRVHVVEQFLISRLTPTEQDKLVLHAISLIYKSKGNIKMKELADALFTSQSPLEKRFRKIVGSSPKKFASIVRMKNAIAQYSRTNSLTDLSYEAGFYDQAHFIKEFKTFTGDTPEQFFSSKE